MDDERWSMNDSSIPKSIIDHRSSIIAH